MLHYGMREFLDDATIRQVMSALSRKRRRGTIPCELCGKPMVDVIVSRQRFCSNRCTVRAFRQRHAAVDEPSPPPN